MIPDPSTMFIWVHLTFANMFVGTKHDRSQYEIITNNIYAVMLRPLLFKSEMHPFIFWWAVHILLD